MIRKSKRSSPWAARAGGRTPRRKDRKSTRLNSSHLVISYAVFCLKKKNKHIPVLDVSKNPSTVHYISYTDLEHSHAHSRIHVPLPHRTLIVITHADFLVSLHHISA